jgi:hypothetical protein
MTDSQMTDTHPLEIPDIYRIIHPIHTLFTSTVSLAVLSIEATPRSRWRLHIGVKRLVLVRPHSLLSRLGFLSFIERLDRQYVLK